MRQGPRRQSWPFYQFCKVLFGLRPLMRSYTIQKISTSRKKMRGIGHPKVCCTLICECELSASGIILCMRSSDDLLLRLIAIFKFLKAALLIALGVGLFNLVQTDLGSLIKDWIDALR